MIQSGNVRTLTEEDGTILFCGKDVAEALGYERPSKAIIDHCKGVLKRDTLTNGGIQELSYITEPDLYRLIVASKLPSAQKFERWEIHAPHCLHWKKTKRVCHKSTPPAEYSL